MTAFCLVSWDRATRKEYYIKFGCKWWILRIAKNNSRYYNLEKFSVFCLFQELTAELISFCCPFSVLIPVSMIYCSFQCKQLQMSVWHYFPTSVSWSLLIGSGQHVDIGVDKISFVCCHRLYFYVAVGLISSFLQNVFSAAGLFELLLLFYLNQYNSLAEFTFLFPAILYLEEIFVVKLRRNSSLQDRCLITGSPECFFMDQI